MPNDFPPAERYWSRKFRVAFRGLKEGVRGQSSFFVHLFLTAMVIAAGWMLRVDRIEWCVLMLCIAGVLTAEMFNSALESMAKAITGESDPHLGNSLDIGSAAVLLASIGAAVVGAIILGNRLGKLLGWW
jgi:diacylglycerol kinase (ATP)